MTLDETRAALTEPGCTDAEAREFIAEYLGRAVASLMGIGIDRLRSSDALSLLRMRVALQRATDELSTEIILTIRNWAVIQQRDKHQR